MSEYVLKLAIGEKIRLFFAKTRHSNKSLSR